MKKLFIISLFALFCTPTHTHAWYEAYTQTTSSNNIKTDISVTATMAVADITITVTNPNKIPIENSLRVYSDILPSGGCETSILNKPIEMDGTTSTYTHTFRLSNLVPNKQYCFQYSGWPPKLFKTDPITTPTGNFFKWPLNVTDPTGQTVVLSGKIDITKYANLSELEVQFYYSKLPFSGTTNPPDTKWLNAHTSLAAGSGEGVAPDGSYYRKIDQLTPKAKYYYKQVIIVKGTTTVLATNFDATATFNSTEGYVPAGSAQEKTLEDAKTYNLLAPWPGLSKLMDPDLCAQQKIDGKLPKGAVCDINGFLNFAFKMLIGLTAVVLVLRLMYEGYQYVVTDVPFLKASAKSGFFTALYGLLLALSAYLILNTINPKLVSNTFNVANVSVGVEQFSISGGATFDGKPLIVKFNAQMYNDAKFASDKTGVQTALILGLFHQETGGGQDTGGCKPDDAKAKMLPAQKTALQSIINKINTAYPQKPNLTIQTVNVSCAGATGNGGAIGYTQFMPQTWQEYDVEATTNLGIYPYPWQQKDALMMTALFLKKYGGNSSEESKQRYAAGRYYGSQTEIVGCGIKGVRDTYGGCVIMKKKGYEEQITKMKASGEIQ